MMAEGSGLNPMLGRGLVTTPLRQSRDLHSAAPTEILSISVGPFPRCPAGAPSDPRERLTAFAPCHPVASSCSPRSVPVFQQIISMCGIWAYVEPEMSVFVSNKLLSTAATSMLCDRVAQRQFRFCGFINAEI
jgi:hypothetical protein